MQMIILAATEGTPLRIDADGEDAETPSRSWPNCSKASSAKNKKRGLPDVSCRSG